MPDSLLQEREKTHGSFVNNANISQSIKHVIHSFGESLHPVQREALDMIALKIARICSNPKVRDHWDDIAGYAKLGAEACDG